jgi:hypothetical protein
LRPKEHKRLIKCLQGDNNMLFWTTTMVIAVESDA